MFASRFILGLKIEGHTKTWLLCNIAIYLILQRDVRVYPECYDSTATKHHTLGIEFKDAM